ncbi:hypothetical protein [Labilibaculum euxinus]
MRIYIVLLISLMPLMLFSQTQIESSPIYYKDGNIGIGTNIPANPLQINSNIPVGKSILFGLNENRLSDVVGSCSANLFILQTRLDAVLGLHSYVYRHSNNKNWATATVRLSSCADGHGYPQNHHYNNMNWIDFVGNAEGINFGIGSGTPILSIKPNDVDINGTITVKNRIYLGKFGATVGIGFNKEYPDYGIFYTEANTDFVSISPNGNEKNGVVNVFGDGKVGIGTAAPKNMLDVNGTIRAKEIKVEANWADFVFKGDYSLRNLTEVEEFIIENGHLPDIPTEKEVKAEGISLGEMNSKLLQKIEELTLYAIQLKKDNQTLVEKQNQQEEVLVLQKEEIKTQKVKILALEDLDLRLQAIEKFMNQK